MPDFLQKAKNALQAIKDRLASKSTKKKDSPIQKCADKKKDEQLGSAVVIVSREDKHEGISGVQVVLEGPTPGSADTNDIGFAQFDDRKPGPYTYKAHFPSGKFQPYNIDGKGQYVPIVEGSLAVPGGGVAIDEIKAYPTGDLRVEVVDETGKAVPLVDVKSLYTDPLSPQSLSEKNQNDHTFKRVKCGSYTVSASVPDTLYAEGIATKTDVNVPEGGVGQARIVVNLLNIVEPHIDADRNELWFEPKAPDAAAPPPPPHLAKADAAAPAEEEKPVKLHLRYTETRPEKPFKDDGVLQFSNGNVAVFTDAECKTPLVLDGGRSAQIKNADLKKGLDLYLKGVAAGAVTATLTLKAPADTAIRVRGPAQQALTVKASNVVEPRLEVEYKVVLLDRKLSDHQEASEKKIIAEPTYILVSAQQRQADPKYTKGALLKAAPANIEVFTDEKCEDKDKLDLSQPIPNDKLFGGAPWKLYLKGKTKGKFTLSLELEDPGHPKIRKLGPVKIDMGVVELEMKLHWHDVAAVKALQVDPDTDPVDTYYTNLKNKALPDQKAMTDEEKVKTGRLLHTQKDNHNGRAKLVVQKLDASQWPDGTDDYQIFINRTNTSGAVELWDKDWEGSAVNLPVGPVTVKDLKAAEKIYWVEGKTVTKDFRQVVLDLTLDRPDKDAPAKSPKRNADWARFTVVQIKELKIDYTAVVGQAVAWDEPQKRFYINLKADPDGRKITIGAQLSEKLKDVVIHLMLAPDKDNMKAANWGIDLPNTAAVTGGATLTWKWKDIDAAVKHKDKADRKDLLHLSAKTNADGYAKLELILSRFGGDKFQPGAYIEQDPHLAKYIHGHTDLEKKKPTLYKDTLQVWRRFWYQIVKVEGINAPGFGPAVGQYERVRADMQDAGNLDVTRATVNGFNPQAIYPMYMVRLNGGGGDALVVSDTNKAQFFAGFTAEVDKPIKVPILVCDAQWDAGGNSAAVTVSNIPASSFPRDVATSKLVLNPPLQGGDLLVSGTWKAAEWNAATGAWVNSRNGNLSNADLTINQTRDDLKKVTVNLPAGVGATTAQTKVWIQNLVVQGANGPYLGESFNQRILAVYESDTQLKRDDFQNTIVHELGHAFHQVLPGAPATGIPPHPIQVDVGQGNHCRQEINKCVMYDSGPIVGSHNRYCDICHPYLLVQDMSNIK